MLFSSVLKCISFPFLFLSEELSKHFVHFLKAFRPLTSAEQYREDYRRTKQRIRTRKLFTLVLKQNNLITSINYFQNFSGNNLSLTTNKSILISIKFTLFKISPVGTTMNIYTETFTASSPEFESDFAKTNKSFPHLPSYCLV